jgi:hypothetical protein
MGCRSLTCTGHFVDSGCKDGLTSDNRGGRHDYNKSKFVKLLHFEASYLVGESACVLLAGMLLRSISLPVSLHCLITDPAEHSLYLGGADGRVFEVLLAGQALPDQVHILVSL